ncbi:hypothetical protein [Nocardioides baekrokdamisoli]|nr:hypothetical protein [Nocardioides baekrokdamisoli]
MTRLRISTTVDEDLLIRARACCNGAKDSTVMERALVALLAEHRAAEIDRRIDVSYAAVEYAVPDAWGSLPGFLDAAGKAHGGPAESW